MRLWKTKSLVRGFEDQLKKRSIIRNGKLISFFFLHKFESQSIMPEICDAFKLNLTFKIESRLNESFVPKCFIFHSI